MKCLCDFVQALTYVPEKKTIKKKKNHQQKLESRLLVGAISGLFRVSGSNPNLIYKFT
jgi:hypothetical protein